MNRRTEVQRSGVVTAGIDGWPAAGHRFLFFAALVYAASTPLDFVPLPGGTPARLTGIVFLAAWGVALLRGSVRVPRAPGLLLVFGALVTWSFTTVFWSYAPNVSLTQATTTLLLVISAVAVSGAFAGNLVGPAFALALGSSVAGVSALVSGNERQTYVGGVIEGQQATFLGIDQNILAFHLSLGLAAALFVLLRAHDTRLRLMAILATTILTVSLIRVGSRTGFGTLLALAVLFVLLSATSRRRAVLALLAMSAAGLGIRRISEAGLVPPRLVEWLHNPLTIDSPRVAIIDLFRATESDWFFKGVGAGADADYLQAAASQYLNAHSAFWKVLIELGLVGLTLWILLLAGLAYRAYRSSGRSFFLLCAIPIALFFYTLGPLDSNMLWVVLGLALGAESAPALAPANPVIATSGVSGRVRPDRGSRAAAPNA